MGGVVRCLAHKQQGLPGVLAPKRCCMVWGQKTNLGVKAAPPRPPQSPIRTTITVTLSAEPRCTALLASLLQAAS